MCYKELTNIIFQNLEKKKTNLIYIYGNDNNRIVNIIKYIINISKIKNYHVYYNLNRNIELSIRKLEKYDLIIISNTKRNIKERQYLNEVMEYCTTNNKQLILIEKSKYFNMANLNNCIPIEINKENFDKNNFDNMIPNLLNVSDDKFERFFEKLYNMSKNNLMKFIKNNKEKITAKQLEWAYNYYKMRECERNISMNNELENINTQITNIFDNKILDYDIKGEIYKNYKKIELPYKKQEFDNYDVKMYNDFVNRVSVAKHSIKTLNQNYIEIFSDNCETKYKYLQRYLLYRYQAKQNKSCFFDCDSSYLVKKYYEINFNYKSDRNNKVYFDTYFSVQSIWGNLIENLYEKKYRNDFRWQIENFNSIINNNPNLEELFNAFDNLAHYYHTLGNIAPCPAGLNKPKGFKINCYDRIDLFFKNEESLKEEWINFYYNGNEILIENLKRDEEIFYLTEFLKPKGLEEVVIPINNNDVKNAKRLSNYINQIVSIIKRRSIKLMKNASNN